MSFLADLAKGGAEGIFSGISSIIKNFKADPLEIAKLEAAVEQAKQQYEQSVVEAVNTTMQAEAHSEHWMQWSWRPVVGFTFCGLVINNYMLYPYMAQFGVIQIMIPETMWAAFLAILGVAAYVRGRDRNGNGNTK